MRRELEWRCENCYDDRCAPNWCARFYEDLKGELDMEDSTELRRIVQEELAKLTAAPPLPEPLARRIGASRASQADREFEERVREVVVKILRERFSDA